MKFEVIAAHLAGFITEKFRTNLYLRVSMCFLCNADLASFSLY